MNRLAAFCVVFAGLVHASNLGAQLRPLDPVPFRALYGDAVHARIAFSMLPHQRASLAGTEGTLWEIGDFYATIRLGRMLMELGGTPQRLLTNEIVYAPPYGDAAPPDADRNRHDAGDYRVGSIIRLTNENAGTTATLRFGTRLPTTDNRVGLDRDAIDFYTTLAAHHMFGLLSIATEAGLAINSTRNPRIEQSDVLVYAVTSEYAMGIATPFAIVLGQQDFRTGAVRGNEDLSELRAGVRLGSSQYFSIAWIRGLADYSPADGVQLSAGMTF